MLMLWEKTGSNRIIYLSIIKAATSKVLGAVFRDHWGWHFRNTSLLLSCIGSYGLQMEVTSSNRRT